MSVEGLGAEHLGVGVCYQWRRGSICLSHGRPGASRPLRRVGGKEEQCGGDMAIMEEPAEGLPGRHGGGASCRQIEEPYYINSNIGECSFCLFLLL